MGPIDYPDCHTLIESLPSVIKLATSEQLR